MQSEKMEYNLGQKYIYIYICVFQVSRPYLRFWLDPKHFIVLKEKKCAVVTKHTAQLVFFFVLCCCCFFFFFFFVVVVVVFLCFVDLFCGGWGRCFVVPITGRLAPKFRDFRHKFSLG